MSNTMIIKRILNKILREYKAFIQNYSKTCFFSIGENCLTQNILQRHHPKTYATPYSHGRSNLGYALKLEKENYSNLLKAEYLYYDKIGELQVVRNKHYSTSDDIYSKAHQKGFEFTHHDVISNESHKTSYERKVLRMQNFNKREKLKFIYHYRFSENNDLNLIILKAEEFLSYYRKREIRCEFIFFTQNIINEQKERTVEKIHDLNNVKGYIFKTLEVWGGTDDDIFWAKKDDDLIKSMLRQIK